MYRAYFSLTNNIDQPAFFNFNLTPSSLLPTTANYHCQLPPFFSFVLHIKLYRFTSHSDSILAALLSSSLHRNNSVVVVVKVGGLYYSPSLYYSYYPGHTNLFFHSLSVIFSHSPRLRNSRCLLCLSLYPSIPSASHHPRRATAVCIVARLLRCRLSRKPPVSLDFLYASISPHCCRYQARMSLYRRNG